MDTTHEDNASDNVLSDLDFAQAHTAVMSLATADFVRRLYNLLEDPANSDIISWTPERDSFVVKETTEFSKQILPPVFSHSNFASFVRQLNKYGFNKVKKTEYNQKGDLTWTFRHPDFHADRPEALKNIKRKPSNQAASNAGTSSGSLPTSNADSSSSLPYASSSSNQQHSSSPFSYSYPLSSSSQSQQHGSRSSEPSRSELKSEIVRLKNEGEDLRTRLRNLERNYEAMLKGLLNVEKAVAQQDRHMENLQRHIVGRSTQQVPSISDRGPTPSASPVHPPQLSLSQIHTGIRPTNMYPQGQMSPPPLGVASPKRKRDDSSSSEQEEDGHFPFNSPGHARSPGWSPPLRVNPGYHPTESTPQSGRLGEPSLWQARDHSKRAQELYASSRSTARDKGRLWPGLNFSSDAQSTISEESEDRSLQPSSEQQNPETEPQPWNQQWDSNLQESFMGINFDPAVFRDQTGSAGGVDGGGGWQGVTHSPGGERVVMQEDENKDDSNQYTSPMSIGTERQIDGADDGNNMSVTGLGNVSPIVVDRDGMNPNYMEGNWGF